MLPKSWRSGLNSNRSHLALTTSRLFALAFLFKQPNAHTDLPFLGDSSQHGTTTTRRTLPAHAARPTAIARADPTDAGPDRS